MVIEPTILDDNSHERGIPAAIGFYQFNIHDLFTQIFYKQNDEIIDFCLHLDKSNKNNIIFWLPGTKLQEISGRFYTSKYGLRQVKKEEFFDAIIHKNHIAARCLLFNLDILT